MVYWNKKPSFHKKNRWVLSEIKMLKSTFKIHVTESVSKLNC